MVDKYTSDFIEFLCESPGVFHAVDAIGRRLERAGFLRLDEKEPSWELVPGGRYFVTRNGSACIAFCLPGGRPAELRIMASHSDSPCFKIKPDPEIEAAGLVRLNIEPYGGLLKNTWYDRPLGVAGRVLVEENGSIVQRLVYPDRDLLVIPSLAIHMDREANEKAMTNVQNDMLPVFAEGPKADKFIGMIAEAAGVDSPDRILGMDLFVVNRQKPFVRGPEDEFISAPRLDDLMCVYGTLAGFVEYAEGREEGVAAETSAAAGDDMPAGDLVTAGNGLTTGDLVTAGNGLTAGDFVTAGNGLKAGVPAAIRNDVTAGDLTAAADGVLAMYCVFDNEEVGSRSRQGAESTFLTDCLGRIRESLGLTFSEMQAAVQRGTMISADNAHAVHPNHTDKADPVNRPKMNGGIVLKFHAGQLYTTDGVSGALVKKICKDNDIPLQTFVNRADMRGGSTLGNIANTQLSISTADIGLAQLAMHSSCETAGARDLGYLAGFARKFYE